MAAAFVALVAVGRIITPQSSNASEPIGDGSPLSLGELRGPSLTVQMFTSAGVTTYSVLDGEGRVLASQIGATELASRFPSLDHRTIHAGRLMLADPGD